MYTKDELDFAYKYPFSDEAKLVVKDLDFKVLDQIHLITGKARLEEALESGKIAYKESNYGKLEFVIGYAYARMLISALKNLSLITVYANAEARRAEEAMAKDTERNILKVSTELGLNVKQENGEYTMDFTTFLQNMPQEEGFELANQKLVKGIVTLSRHQLIKVIRVAVGKEVAKGLPVKSTNIPKAVVDYAKGVRVPVPKIVVRTGSGSISWIDRLIQIPIADARHRTVNLILAPYLVTIKGLSVEKATETISNYITLCKTVNPDTKVTDRYIKYQCEYAKSHGLKPLSLARAKVELGGGIDFNILLGEDVERKVKK